MRARDAAVSIVYRLRAAGYTAHLAGGCVRDALLGMEPKDYDVATDARPDAVGELFARSKAVGESFGVALVHESGHDIEVATFREEWGYADGRRPSEVRFTDAEHDAQRRDFTINGMFADPAPESEDRADRIIDYVGGQADLEAGIIRAIGEPDERFGEDYLRMLRAVRFAARLGFEIEPSTAASIRIHAEYLDRISRERIGIEVLAMLAGPNRARAAKLIQSLRLDGPTLSEDPAAPPLTTLEALTGDAAPTTALAAWMIDRGSQAHVSRWRRALCLSNDDRDALRGVLKICRAAEGWNELGVAGRKRMLASSSWAQALHMLRALGRAELIEREAAPLLAEGVAPPQLIDGDDLIALGLEPGPNFRRWLDGVYDAQLEGRVASRDEALAWVRRNTAP